jgi:hypothetical protein
MRRVEPRTSNYRASIGAAPLILGACRRASQTGEVRIDTEGDSPWRDVLGRLDLDLIDMHARTRCVTSGTWVDDHDH